ncbi:hypothetical protein DPMN_075577 [Dreissena polymorpha]|uniref:Uncharacterized protein n=1 Tax=Dreissena polymorpha TaxID=45954 RepID=A0A9D3YKR1_DREPO|nr:hypothetical protein DPMN_075577 [Dreissena polymorpha]
MSNPTEIEDINNDEQDGDNTETIIEEYVSDEYGLECDDFSTEDQDLPDSEDTDETDYTEN